MDVLIVGAGAVGQVYGRHLALGGARVTYFVRDKYAEECRRGLVFYPLNRRRPRAEPVRMALAADQVVTRIEEVAARRWDQVYLCVSSPALHGPWLRELVAAIGDATIVALQPGSDDRTVLLAAAIPEARLVAGMITVVSYHAPLDGDEHVPEPGMAYWFPPGSPAPFSGPPERTRAVVDALRRGRQPARVRADVPALVRFPSALLMTLLTALEAAGWSFVELRRSRYLALVRPATREAFAIIAKRYAVTPPRLLGMVARPFWIRRVMTLARWVMPLPIETYLRVHFTKVRDQTRMFMRGYIANGEELGMSTEALRALESAVDAPAAAAR